jgi:hypothetical protein
MIIFFGSRSGHLKTLKAPGQCRTCRTNDSLELLVDQKFAHIFWIPMFPIRKIYTAECYQCKDFLTEAEIKASHPLIYQETRKTVTTPFWSFTGLALIFSFILLISILGYIRTIKHQFMIQTPKSGDIYKYLSKEGEFSLLKVSEIIGDTVYVYSNSYTTRNTISMRKLIDESQFSFSSEPGPKLRSDLIQMFENGEIINIERE